MINLRDLYFNSLQIQLTLNNTIFTDYSRWINTNSNNTNNINNTKINKSKNFPSLFASSFLKFFTSYTFSIILRQKHTFMLL